MNIAIIVIITALVITAVIFSFKKFKALSAKKILQAPSDPAAQAAYSADKHKDEKKTLTIAQRLELSWKFLSEITEIILNKFSKQDQEIVKEIGGVLVKNGVRYNHNIDLAIAPILAKSKTRDKEFSKQHTEGISI